MNHFTDFFTVLFFFNDTATTEIYTLSLHDALPICLWPLGRARPACCRRCRARCLPVQLAADGRARQRSEEHTSELQSRQYLVCRLLLEKKKNRAIDVFHVLSPQPNLQNPNVRLTPT